MNTLDSSSKAETRDLKGVRGIRLATLCLLTIVVLSGAFVAAWFAGVGAIQRIFAQIQFMQEANPMWLEVPIVMGGYLLAPTVVLFLLALLVMKVSPQLRTWSRVLVVCILPKNWV